MIMKRRIFIAVFGMVLLIIIVSTIFNVIGKKDSLFSQSLHIEQEIEKKDKNFISGDSSDVSQESDWENNSSSENTLVESEVIEGKTEFKVREKAEASYEKWLAAEMIIAISLQYSEYEFKEIYLASDTELSNYMSSEGVYIILNINEEEIAFQAKPIAYEREILGTIDLYTEDLGFAAFEEIAVENIDTKNLVSVELDELSDLISQSILVSIYEH